MLSKQGNGEVNKIIQGNEPPSVQFCVLPKKGKIILKASYLLRDRFSESSLSITLFL